MPIRLSLCFGLALLILIWGVEGAAAASGDPGEPGADVSAPHQQQLSLIGVSWQGGYSSVEQPLTRVVRSEAEWQDLWAMMGSAAPPDFPFFGEGVVMAVAIFAGLKRTGGYSIEILEVDQNGDALTVNYRIHEPTGVVTMALTTPYLVQIVPFAAGPVTFVAQGDPR